MELITPAIGLVFWTTVVFVLLVFLLSKFAWKPILSAVKEREENISKSLKQAEKAQQDLRELQSINEKLITEAKVERDNMLRDAKEVGDKMIAEAKSKATIEAEKILTQTRETLAAEKNAAMSELRTQVAQFSVEVAEKILRAELSSDAKQKALNTQLLDDVKLN